MYKNLDEALVGSLRLLLEKGDVVPSRNGETRELWSHHMVIENPLQRVLLAPGRGHNPFAALAETMWVLAGRNDLEFLGRYLPRAGDFSDDGKTWRGGYGPRLRAWERFGGLQSQVPETSDPTLMEDRKDDIRDWVSQAYKGLGLEAPYSLTNPDPICLVDQLEECVKILTEDPNSRRAVMVIFDPSLDYCQSKDIPCNNWVAFKIRSGKLNMTIGVRSNDVIWGFSGINVFEWSVLQQMMAHWTGTEVGKMGYLADSFHLYDYHYEKAQTILAGAKAKTLYDFGFKTPEFSTYWEDFPALMDEFFSLEQLLHEGDYAAFDLHIGNIKDEFVRTTLLMLKAYTSYLNREKYLAHASESSWEPTVYLRPIAEQVNEIPAGDLRVAAIDYFRRQKGFGEKFMALVSLDAQERAFFEYLSAPPKTDISFEEVFATLKVLHEKKTRSYGNSWKKHGEVLGVFSNITRKRDRLVNLLAGAKATADEGLFDTFSDLCVYAGKYLTLIAELYPNQFLNKILVTRDVVLDGEVDGFQGNEGFDAVLDELIRSGWVECAYELLETVEDCMEFIEVEYASMEKNLLGNNRIEDGSIATNSAKMCIACAQALRILSHENPGLWDSYSASVERL